MPHPYRPKVPEHYRLPSLNELATNLEAIEKERKVVLARLAEVDKRLSAARQRLIERANTDTAVTPTDGPGKKILDCLRRSPGADWDDLALAAYGAANGKTVYRAQNLLYSLSKKGLVRKLPGRRGRWGLVEQDGSHAETGVPASSARDVGDPASPGGSAV